MKTTPGGTGRRFIADRFPWEVKTAGPPHLAPPSFGGKNGSDAVAA
ncbi:hypothetical protein ACFSOZ_20055 [Mesorhizobium newzealandense]|uniref:Uncharacterized protein n=1 Tax=Mesorhizobium newzealandense TaxID=1300302 RepID=A0ABW4UCY5_9HYPH